MPKRINTFRYRILSKGTKKQAPFRIKFWLWGFGFTYETKKWIGGFSINSHKYKPKNILLDSYTHKK